MATGGKDDRLQRLEQTLAQGGVLKLREAAELLGVAEMTVRRDLAASAGRLAFLGGHIVRTGDLGGGYSLQTENDRQATAKQAACRHALALIQPDDTIFIDCGSTLVHLAAMLPQPFRGAVICYSLNVANQMARRPDVRMILLGGEFHRASESFAGPEAGEVLARLGINVAFLSAGGFDMARGASCAHFHEVAVKQAAMRAAARRVLVVDIAKIGRVRPAFFAQMADFDVVLTEQGAMGASGALLDGNPALL